MIFCYPTWDDFERLTPATHWWWSQGATMAVWVAVNEAEVERAEWFGSHLEFVPDVVEYTIDQVPPEGSMLWATPGGARRQFIGDDDPPMRLVHFLAEMHRADDPGEFHSPTSPAADILDAVIAEARALSGLEPYVDTLARMPHYTDIIGAATEGED